MKTTHIYKEVEVEITAEDIKKLDLIEFEWKEKPEIRQGMEDAALLLRKHSEIAAASRIEAIIRQEF